VGTPAKVSRRDVARPVLTEFLMLKRPKTRKLELKTTTIQQLTTKALENVAGGFSATCSEADQCNWYTRGGTCSCNFGCN
jgi:hypothetical protein